MRERSVDQAALQQGAEFLNKDEMSPELLERTIRYSIARKQSEQELLDMAAQLRQFNEHLEDLVQKRTHDLDLAHRQLQDIDQLKTRFIVNISHELRNPLTIIQCYLSLMKSDMTQYKAEYMDFMEVQCERITKITDK